MRKKLLIQHGTKQAVIWIRSILLFLLLNVSMQPALMTDQTSQVDSSC